MFLQRYPHDRLLWYQYAFLFFFMGFLAVEYPFFMIAMAVLLFFMHSVRIRLFLCAFSCFVGGVFFCLFVQQKEYQPFPFDTQAFYGVTFVIDSVTYKADKQIQIIASHIQVTDIYQRVQKKKGIPPPNNIIHENKKFWYVKTRTLQEKIVGKALFRIENAIQFNFQEKGIITAVVQVRSPVGLKNPHTFDTQNYYEQQGIDYLFSPREQIASILYDPPSKNPTYSTLLQQKYTQFLQKNLAKTPYTEQIFALMYALLFGNRYYFTPKLQEMFTHAGLLHSVVLSGLHLSCVGLLGILVLWCVRLCVPRVFLYIPKKTLYMLIVFSIALLYAYISNFPVSFLRAFWMLFFYCCGMLFYTRITLFDALFFAVLVFFLFDPMVLYSVSLQISVLCVFAIYCTLPFLQRALQRVQNLRIKRIWKKIFCFFLSITCISWGIQLVLLPYQLSVFTVYSYSFWINLLWLPVLSAFVLPSLLLSFFLSTLHLDFLAQIFLLFAEYPVQWLLQLLLWLKNTGNLTPFVGIIPHTATIIGYILLLVMIYCIVTKQSRRKIPILFVSMLLFFTYPVYVTWMNTHDTTLQCTLFDVGNGQALLLETQGKRVLIDAGASVHTFDAGERILSPYLRYNQRGAIDTVFISHQDNDHAGGAIYLIKNHRVDAVYHNGFFTHPSKTTKNLSMQIKHYKKASYIVENGRRVFNNTHTKVHHSLKTGDEVRITDSLIVRVLSPDTTHNVPTSNDRSLVLLVEYKKKPRMLVMGDTTVAMQSNILTTFQQQSIPVIVAAHHGSKHNFYTPFYEYFAPKIVLVSNGKQDNNFLPPTMQQFFKEHGIQLFSTKKQGALQVFFQENTVIVKPFCFWK